MSKADKVQQRHLANLEHEFDELLPLTLQACARGRWGLFGQNEVAESEADYLQWPKAQRLKDLAEEIQTIRRTYGTSNEICSHFLHLRSLRGANIPGEPKLAADFIERLQNK